MQSNNCLINYLFSYEKCSEQLFQTFVIHLNCCNSFFTLPRNNERRIIEVQIVEKPVKNEHLKLTMLIKIIREMKKISLQNLQLLLFTTMFVPLFTL